MIVPLLVIGHEDVGEEAVAEDILGDVLGVSLPVLRPARGRRTSRVITSAAAWLAVAGAGFGRGLAALALGRRSGRRHRGRVGGRRFATRRRRSRGASWLLPGGDPLGQLQREGGELGVVLGRDDLGVIPPRVEERAAGGGVALVADRHGLELVRLLRAVLAQRLERIGHLEDVELELVRRVAGRVIEGVGHPLDAILDEALGAAVDLLVEVVGVERLEVVLARLADGPFRRQVRERQHGGDLALGLGDGGQLGLDLGRAQSVSGRGAGAGGLLAGPVPVAAAGDGRTGCRQSGRGHRSQIDRRRGVIEQLLRAVDADALAHAGQRCKTRGNRCATAGDVPATARSASIASSSFLTLSTRFFRSSASRSISCLTAASASLRFLNSLPCSSTDQVSLGSNS